MSRWSRIPAKRFFCAWLFLGILILAGVSAQDDTPGETPEDQAEPAAGNGTESHIVEMALTDAQYDGSDINEFLDAHAVNDYRIGGPARTADGYCRLYLYNLSSDDAASCLLIHDIKISGDTWDLGPEIRGFLNQARSERTLCRDYGLWDEDSEIVIDFQPPDTVQDEGFLLIDVHQVQPYGDSITVPDFIRFNRTEQKLDNNQRVTITIPLFIESSHGSGQTPPDTPAQEEMSTTTPENKIEPTHTPLRKPIIEIAITDTKVAPENIKLLRKHWIDLNKPLNPPRPRREVGNEKTGNEVKPLKSLYVYNVSTGNDTYFKITGISFEYNRYMISNKWEKGVVKFQSDTGPLTIAFSWNPETESTLETDTLNISFEVFKGDNRQFKVNGKQMSFQKAGKGVLAIKVDPGAGIGFTEIVMFVVIGIAALLVLLLVIIGIVKMIKKARKSRREQRPEDASGAPYDDGSLSPGSGGMVSHDYDHLQRQINEIRTKTTDSRESLERLEQAVHEKMDRSEQAKLITIDTIDQWIGRSQHIQELDGAIDAQKHSLKKNLETIQSETHQEITAVQKGLGETLEKRTGDLERTLKKDYVSWTAINDLADAMQADFNAECRTRQDDLRARLVAGVSGATTGDSDSKELLFWISQKYVEVRNILEAANGEDVSTLLQRIENLRKSLAGMSGKSEDADMSVLEKEIPDIPDLFPPEIRSNSMALLKRLVQMDLSRETAAFQTTCDTFARQRRQITASGPDNFQKKYMTLNGFSTFARLLIDARKRLENKREILDEIYHELKRRCDVREIVVNVNRQRFDPEMHDVIREEISKYPEGTVIEEIEKGYIYHDKVFQKAKVCISRGRM